MSLGGGWRVRSSTLEVMTRLLGAWVECTVSGDGMDVGVAGSEWTTAYDCVGLCGRIYNIFHSRVRGRSLIYSMFYRWHVWAGEQGREIGTEPWFIREGSERTHHKSFSGTQLCANLTSCWNVGVVIYDSLLFPVVLNSTHAHGKPVVPFSASHPDLR